LTKIVKDFRRLNPKVIEKYKDFSTPIVSDSMGKFNCMRSDIKPCYPGARICGPALTINTYMGDNLMLHVGLKLAKPGDILVVSTGGCLEGGYWGEIMSLSAITHQLGGLVIEGGIRDVEKIQEIGFPVFSSNISPRGTFKVNPGALNIPINCGGISVSPGDLILGDEDGVAVVPYDSARAVLARAESAQRKEAILIERVLKGEYIFDILKLEDFIKI
jgi:4-hydroxy-4-methyl-2-oxoglutarate aldolase